MPSYVTSGASGVGLFGVPTTGVFVSKKPKSVKSRQALYCEQCHSTWLPSMGDPAEHRLRCVQGWTPEFGVFTLVFWEGHIQVRDDLDDV